MIDGMRLELLNSSGFKLGVNYGWNRVRFPAPVPAGSRIRTTAEVTEVEEAGGVVVFEVELRLRHRLAAEFLDRARQRVDVLLLVFGQQRDQALQFTLRPRHDLEAELAVGDRDVRVAVQIAGVAPRVTLQGNRRISPIDSTRRDLGLGVRGPNPILEHLGRQLGAPVAHRCPDVEIGDSHGE